MNIYRHVRTNLTAWVFCSALVFGVSVRAEVLINLDATGLPDGPLSTWLNTGTLPGNFNSAGAVVPQVTNVLSGRGISFIATGGGAGGTHYLGPIAPPAVTGTNSRSIEAWIYNPTLQPEEVVFGWGRRNGAPDGSNVSFNHGTDPAFGAVGHWGAPDIGWGGNPTTNLVSSRWTYIAYTYDAATATIRVYKDGQLANTEISVPPLNTHSNSTATPPTPLPFRVARQNGGAGTPSGTGVGQLFISRIRVHDVPVPIETLQANFENEKCAFGLCDTDTDGLPDYYEDQNNLDRNNPKDAAGDLDGDGATNLQEFQIGTLANNPDTDGDGASDGAEINRMDGGAPAPTNPLVADTDEDGLRDGAETDTGIFVSTSNTGSDPLNLDTDGDGFSDAYEARRGTNPSDPSSLVDLPFINLDATGLELGSLVTWTNSGMFAGNFAATSTVPAVVTVQNIRGVSLDGAVNTGAFYTGPGAPDYMTGNQGRSIEAWIYNPEPSVPEETIFAWARRGGPDGSNMSFNHGTDLAFGAVGHWGGGPDIGWNGASNVVQGRWTYVAYTYNPTNRLKTVYSDGRAVNSEINGAPLATFRFDNTGTNLLPFRVGAQNEANGTPTPNLRGGMIIARIRVYDTPLTAGAISNKFALEAEEFGQDDRDGDGIPTWFERLYAFLNPTDPADGPLDQDSDGLSNLEEYQSNTLPDDPDSDDDGATDTAEVRRTDNGVPAPTNPRRADTDQDGLLDSVETDTGIFVSGSDTGSDPLRADTDGDGFADGQEVLHASNPNDGFNTPDFEFTDPLAIINLSAAGLPPGPLASWTNTGALGGTFRASADLPQVTTIGDTKAVTLSGTNNYYTGPITPVFMTGASSRTVEAWIYNPQVADEETIFAWGRRGGPDGANCSFNHGANSVFGAVGHWGAADLGWNGNISTSRWTFVAYTFDKPSQVAAVYRDGQLANSGVRTNINTLAVDAIGNGLPFRLGAQNEPNGSATPGLMGSMSIARLRVYDEALPATGDNSIQSHFVAERPLFLPPGLSIQFDSASGTATITWGTAAGRTYAVDASNDLQDWTSRATGLTTGTFTDSSAGTASMRFYRVQVE
jgi:hypothetical protein